MKEDETNYYPRGSRVIPRDPDPYLRGGVCGTVKEMQDLSQRLQVATMLNRGEKYQTIEQVTGASTATISRVNKCLVYGSGGYRTVLARLDDGQGKE